MSKTIKPEDQKKARDEIRKKNNLAIVDGLLYEKGKKRQAPPPPPVPGKVFSHAGWARVVESSGRVADVIGTMELAKAQGDIEGVAALVELLAHEATELAKDLGGHP